MYDWSFLTQSELEQVHRCLKCRAAAADYVKQQLLISGKRTVADLRETDQEQIVRMWEDGGEVPARLEDLVALDCENKLIDPLDDVVG